MRRSIKKVLTVAVFVVLMLALLAGSALAAPPDSVGRIDLQNNKPCETTRDIEATRDIPLMGVPPVSDPFFNCYVIMGPGRRL